MGGAENGRKVERLHLLGLGHREIAGLHGGGLPGLGGLADGERATAVVAAAIRCRKFSPVRSPVVNRLPGTAGMRSRSGDRQRHRGKGAHEQQKDQKSGGQAMHGVAG